MLGIVALLGPGFGDDEVRTLAFVTLIAADVALVFAARGHRYLRGRNPATHWMLAAVAGVLLLTLAIPWLRTLFQFARVGWPSIGIAVLVGAAPVLAFAYIIRGGSWRADCSRVHT